jgi:L,D-transpeptidase catalytic domain
MDACAAATATSIAIGCALFTGCSETPGNTAAVSPPAEIPREEPAAPPAAAETEPAPSAAAREGAPGKPEDLTEAPTAPKASAPPRIYAKARFVWIQTAPRVSPGWLGYLSLGGSVALRGGSVAAARAGSGGGCDTWYAVEPRGYVCAGDTATIDPDDPIVVALAKDAPQTNSPWPYEYGESIGAPRYPRIPTLAEQRRAEWDLPAHQKRIERARASTNGEGIDKEIRGVDLTPAGVPMPDLPTFGPLVRDDRAYIVNGSTVAYTRAFDVDGRTYLLAHDKAFIPKDRVRPYPRSSFQGVMLGGEVTLPLAFFRKTERPKYRRGEDGVFVKTGESWPARSYTRLTGEETKVAGQRFLATREPGIYVLADDASVVRAATTLPPGKGEPKRVSDTAAPAKAASKPDRRTWIEVSVLGGWLVAYEGMTPVFATLISPGRGGIPYDGIDPLDTASTPTGSFRVDGKFVTATMVSSTNENIVHTEVQYIENFHGPHALHAAYWHDAWGEPKSGGCVNLSPIDARWIFSWSEPALPDGWYGIRSAPEFGPATAVVLHR